MRSPNLYQYTAIGGFTHAKAIFLPPVELGVYFHALRHQGTNWAGVHMTKK